MTTIGNKTRCVTCGKDKVTYECDGCLHRFCFYHLAEHRQQLEKQLDDIENQRNVFQQTLSEQTINLQKHSFIQQINQWEEKSIEKIKQTANEARDSILEYTNEYIEPIEMNLTKLTKEIKEIREENDFNEMNLNELKEKLKELEEQLNQPSNITIKEVSLSFIKKISVVLPSQQLTIPKISINAKWTQYGITVAGGDGHGNELNQLSYPFSVYVHDEQTIYVADTANHRIVVWKNEATTGQVVAGGNGQGTRNDQLSGPINVIIDYKNDSFIVSDRDNQRVVRWPRQNGTSGETIISNVTCFGLAMDNNGYLYVSELNKHEVKRWKIGEKNGVIVAGGNEKGDRLDQLNQPRYIFVDQDQSLYVSDGGNHRVMKWLKGAKEGIVVAGNQGKGNSLTQLSYPQGIIVDQLDTLYVADSGNHRVMRWWKGATQGSIVVGGNGRGEQTNQFEDPFDLTFDQQNTLYVVDQGNHRIQKFQIDSSN